MKGITRRDFMKGMMVGGIAAGSAGLLAACGSSGSSSSETSQAQETETSSSDAGASATSAEAEEVELGISWWGSQTRNDTTVSVLDLYTSENPNITFQPEFSDWSGYWSKLATQVAGNSVPDIIQMDRTYLSTYVSNGQLADLTPYIENGVLDASGIPESTLSTGEVDGSVYALVLGVNVPCMFYDIDVVDEAGVSLPDEMNYETFFDICRTIYEKTGIQTDLDYGMEETYLNLYLRDKGYYLFAESGTELGVPDWQPIADFFQMYVDGLEEGFMVSPEVFVELDPSSTEQNTLVLGKSWCTILFSNQMSSIVSAAGRDIGITSVPADDLTALQYIKPSQYFCVSANSEHAEEAVAFLSWFVNDEEANEILLGERGTPANSEIADYIAPMMDETEQKVIAFIDKVSENCSEISPLVPEGSSEIAAMVSEKLEEVCYGTKSAEEAAQEFFEEANAILSANQ